MNKKTKSKKYSLRNNPNKSLYKLLKSITSKVLQHLKKVIKLLWKVLISLWNFLKGANRTFAELLVIFSFAVGVVTLSSYIGVTCEPPLDSDNILYTTPFIVENKGLLPIYSVNFSVRPRKIFYGDSGKIIGTGRIPSIDKPNTFRQTKTIKIIRPNEKATVFIAKTFIFPDTVNHIDIDIVINYLDYFSLKQEKHLRFVSNQDYQGNLVLFPQPVLD